MIEVTTSYQCRASGSENIVRNGTNKAGSAQYHCKNCGVYRVLEPKQNTAHKQREQVLKAYQERASLRGLARIFGIARHRVMNWILAHLQKLPTLVDSLLPKHRGDSLELDEQWAFVYQKEIERWLWTALCRRTRQIVACVIGDRSADTCGVYGTPFRQLIAAVAPTPTSGRLTKLCCLSVPIIQSARKRAKRLIKSAGI
jgi:transposase-like protein